MSSSVSPAPSSHLHNPELRRPLLMRMLLASMIILVLAQGLNAVLMLAAQRNASLQTLATAIRISGHEQVFHIENAMRLGKPLTQMHGLDATLAGLRGSLPFVTAVAVSDAGGTLLQQDGGGLTDGLLATTLAEHQGAALLQRRTDAGQLYLLPIHGQGRQLSGFLVFLLPDSAVTASLQDSRAQTLQSLASSSALGLLLLFAATLLLQRCPERLYRRALFIAPFAAVLIAQAVFSWHHVAAFRASYLTGVSSNVQRASDSLGREFERLLALGVGLERFHGLDAPFQRMLDDIPELASVALLDAQQQPLFRHVRSGSTPTDATGAPILTPLRTGAGDAAKTVGVLSASLSADALSRGIGRRVFDALTVALTSAIFVGELLILLAALMHRHQQAARQPASGRPTARPLLARTAAFTLLFAWALPLAIVPLHMASLLPAGGPVPADLLKALPVSAEMLFALLATLFAGRWADQRGWHWPFLAGTLICAAGGLLAALTASAGAFIVARALVGLGYGLAWMGIQSHVYAASSPRTQMHAIASLVAGIFAGHLCGSATGGMLAEQFGNPSVFLLSALLGLLPLLFAIVFMREHFRTPPPATPSAGSGGLRELLADRGYLALLALCVVPFSIVQVGLLYYALPVHLGAQGASPADTGRILMIYGLSVIYLGPLLGRWLGRFRQRQRFIVLAGLLGGGGLAALYLDAGLWGMLLAVFLLGVASSFGGPAQSSFALQLPAVQRAGKNRAMAIQRTADKLGQLLGPLLMGGLFALLGSQAGLSLAGLLYMLCAVAFWLLTRDAQHHTVVKP